MGPTHQVQTKVWHLRLLNLCLRLLFLLLGLVREHDIELIDLVVVLPLPVHEASGWFPSDQEALIGDNLKMHGLTHGACLTRVSGNLRQYCLMHLTEDAPKPLRRMASSVNHSPSLDFSLLRSFSRTSRTFVANSACRDQ